MLPFFPTPYPDELLYSVLARYHLWNNNKYWGNTFEELFGYPFACVSVDLPKRLMDLYRRLPEGTLNTLDSIIQRNTLFPLYRAFLPDARAKQIVQAMKNSKKGFSIRALVGGMYGKITTPEFLRYCPECKKADKELYGESYWHRTHQVSGVKVCPHHQVWLVESNVPFSVERSNRALIALDSDYVHDKLVLSSSNKHHPHYVAVSQSVHWLLNNETPVLGLFELTNRYKKHLKLINYANENGRVKQQKLAEAFINFYGVDFLEENNILLNPGSSMKNWLRKIVWECKQVTHPIRHIFFITFLGITPKKLLLEDIEYYPFGKGPWPCINPAASHYNQLVIKKYEIRYNRKRLSMGVFSCSCGFIYYKCGPDWREQDKNRIMRYKVYGPVWEKKLLHLALEKHMSLYKIAQQLNVSDEVVKKQLDRLQGKCVNQESKEEILNDIDKLKDYRIKILSLINNYPNKSRSELRFMAQREYYYLSIYDRKWLEKHLPETKPRDQYRRTVDWLKRDEELAVEVSHAVEKIRGSLDKPQRVTVASIRRLIGRLEIFKKLDRLPKTKKILDEVTESTEEFHIRRVRYAIKNLKERGQKLSLDKICREAGLWISFQKLSDRVMEEIKRAINPNTNPKVS